MILLDIIEPGRPYRRPIRRIVEDTVDTVRDTLDATKEAVSDSLNQSQVILDNVGQSEASLLWPIAVIALALGACLYMAYLYKRRLNGRTQA